LAQFAISPVDPQAVQAGEVPERSKNLEPLQTEHTSLRHLSQFYTVHAVQT